MLRRERTTAGKATPPPKRVPTPLYKTQPALKLEHLNLTEEKITGIFGTPLFWSLSFSSNAEPYLNIDTLLIQEFTTPIARAHGIEHPIFSSAHYENNGIKWYAFFIMNPLAPKSLSFVGDLLGIAVYDNYQTASANDFTLRFVAWDKDNTVDPRKLINVNRHITSIADPGTLQLGEYFLLHKPVMTEHIPPSFMFKSFAHPAPEVSRVPSSGAAPSSIEVPQSPRPS